MKKEKSNSLTTKLAILSGVLVLSGVCAYVSDNSIKTTYATSLNNTNFSTNITEQLNKTIIEEEITEENTTEATTEDTYNQNYMHYVDLYGVKPTEKPKYVNVNGYDIEYISGAPYSVYEQIAKIREEAELTTEPEIASNEYIYAEESYDEVKETTTTSSTEETTTSTSENSNMTYYSTMELTAYCWTGNPCADGVYPEIGYTVACNDPNLWHKWVYIEGVGNRYIHDTGGMASNVIDVYLGDYDSCIQFGRRTANVYILN